MKKLTRSTNNKVIGGVLGGFAEYFGIDATWLRLGYVIFSLFTIFPGILFYVIAWIIIPNHIIVTAEPAEEANEEPVSNSSQPEEKTEEVEKDSPTAEKGTDKTQV